MVRYCLPAGVHRVCCYGVFGGGEMRNARNTLKAALNILAALKQAHPYPLLTSDLVADGPDRSAAIRRAQHNLNAICDAGLIYDAQGSYKCKYWLLTDAGKQLLGLPIINARGK